MTMLMGAGSALADSVYLVDGSRINGTIVSLSADQLRFQTGFSDALAIPRDQLLGLTSESTLPVEMKSGRLVQLRFDYVPDGGSQALVTDGGNRRLADAQGLARVKRVAPRVVAAQQDDETLALPESDNLPPSNGDYWTGGIEFAVSGKSGNSETSSLFTEASALRDTGNTRWTLSASVDREEEDQERTAEEYLGETRFEHDITRRVFWFAQQELERDELEDIDLRSRTLVGPGLFLLRRDRMTFKLRSGAGYQYERYSDGESSSEPIASVGWDYEQLVGEWLHLSHELTSYPEIANSPSENFVLESVLGAQVPIAGGDAWNVRASLEHEYNNNPEPGVEDLDTAYRIGIVRDF